MGVIFITRHGRGGRGGRPRAGHVSRDRLRRFGRGLRPAAARLTRAAVGGAAPGEPCTARTSPRHFRCCAWTTRSRARRKRRLQPRPVARPSTVRRENGPVLKVRDLTTTFDITGGILGRVQSACTRSRRSVSTCTPARRCRWWAKSGCGKTTTGRSLLQLVRAGPAPSNSTAGTSARCAALRLPGSSSRGPFASLDPRMTVGYSIMEPLLIHGVARGKGGRGAGALADGQVRPAARDDRPLSTKSSPAASASTICIARARWRA